MGVQRTRARRAAKSVAQSGALSLSKGGALFAELTLELALHRTQHQRRQYQAVAPTVVEAVKKL